MGLDDGNTAREAERAELLRAIDEELGDGGVPKKQPDDQPNIDRVPGVFTLLDLVKQRILKSLWGFLDIAGLRSTSVFDHLEENLNTVLKEHTQAINVDPLKFFPPEHMKLAQPLIKKLVELYTLRAHTEFGTGAINESILYVIAALQLCLVTRQPTPAALIEVLEELLINITDDNPYRRTLFHLRMSSVHIRVRPPVTLDELIDAAKSAEARGDIEMALGFEMEIVRRKPAAIIGRYRCVDFLMQLGRLPEAERFLYATERLMRDLAARDAKRMGNFWDEIETRMLQDKPPPSHDYRSITDDERRSSSLRMLTRWTEQARGKGDFTAAILFSKAILERLPDDFSALDRLAKDYLNSEEFMEAIRIRERMVELWPADPIVKRRLEAAKNEWMRAEQNIPSQRDRFRKFLNSLLEKTVEWEFPEGRSDPYRKIPEAELEALKAKFAKFEELFLRNKIFDGDECRKFWGIFGQLKGQILAGYLNTMVIRNLLMRIAE